MVSGHSPERYHLIGYFLQITKEKNENLKRRAEHAILTGCHPRLGMLAITDLKLEPDILCFQFRLPTGDLLEEQPLTLAEIKHLLRAIHRQGIWSPEAR